MIRVCHVTSVHTTSDERIFHKECISLAKNGYEVILVGPGQDKVDTGVQIIGVGGKPVSRIKRMFSFTKKVYKKALELDCDIYHFHDPELLPYANKMKKQGKTVIFDSHEDAPAQLDEKDYLPQILKKIIIKCYATFEKQILKKMDAVITVTPHVVDRIKQICDNTIMVTNYPKIENCGENLDRSVSEENTVCFTGAINEGWGHTQIAKAMRLLDEIQYHLYGNADDSFIAKLKSIAGENKVHYKGYIDHRKILQVQSSYVAGMCLCEYCANTGWKIGTLGNTKLFEYMYAGIPVICTDFDLWKEIIEKYQCGICVSPDNIEEIAKAIQYYVEHSEMALLHGANGRKAVIEKYNWLGEERKLVDLYKKLPVRNL